MGLFKKEENQSRILNDLTEKYKRGNLNIFVIGAGALSNFVMVGLADLRLGRIVIFDKDKIEETNLNRQVLYFDEVGNYKAVALKKRLKQISTRNVYDYKLKFFEEDSRKYFGWFGDKPDILIDCVDNFKTRSLLNKFALKYKIPLISGGTSPFSGQVVVYVPGVTSCLNCQLDIDRLSEERERERQGCTIVPEGSVVTTNQIIGGIMVGEIDRLLNGITPTPGIIRYISADEDRIGLSKSKPCQCHLNKVEIPASKKFKLELPSFNQVRNKIKSYFIEEEL